MRFENNMTGVKKMSAKCKEFVNPTCLGFIKLPLPECSAGRVFNICIRSPGSGLCQQPSAAINDLAASWDPQLPRS